MVAGRETQVARVFRFFDILGSELHTIDDPEDKLPLPRIGQVITIGNGRMRVTLVTHNQATSSTVSVYVVRVRAVPASNY